MDVATGIKSKQNLILFSDKCDLDRPRRNMKPIKYKKQKEFLEVKQAH